MIKQGNKKANDVADKTLFEMKKAMGIDYFSDDSFEREQIKKFSRK